MDIRTFFQSSNGNSVKPNSSDSGNSGSRTTLHNSSKDTAINKYKILENKGYFNIERIVANIFNNTFNTNTLNLAPAFSFSKLVLQLTDKLYYETYQPINNVIKLLTIKHNKFYRYKFNDFIEINLTDGYDKTIFNIITNDLEYRLTTEEGTEKDAINRELIDNIKNLNSDILKLFIIDLTDNLKHIVKRYDIYFIMKPLQINLINSFKFKTDFYVTAFVQNITMYLLGTQANTTKLSQSTVFKFRPDRNNELYNSYFGYKDGRAETNICITKKTLANCLKFITEKYTKMYLNNNLEIEPVIYDFSPEIINSINRLSDKKINNILDTLSKYSIIDILDDEKQHVYEYNTTQVLNDIGSFITDMSNKKIEHSVSGNSNVGMLDDIKFRLLHPLKKKQQKAIKNLEKYPINIITGGPGTGKTTTVSKTPEYYISKGYDVWMLSPTGKAASKLKKDVLFAYRENCTSQLRDAMGAPCLPIGIDIMTIHSKIGTLGQTNYDKFQVYNTNKIVLFIEESSMMGCELFTELINLIDHLDIILEQVIILGDENQLPPVKSSCKSSILSVLIEIYNLHKYNIGYTELTECCRVDETGKELVTIFQDVAKGNTSSLKRALSNKINCVENITNKEFYKTLKHIDDYDKNMIITFRNNDVNFHNSICQQQKFNLKTKNECFKAKSDQWEFKNNTYLPGDRVINLKNNNKAEIYNGTIGTIHESKIKYGSKTVTVLYENHNDPLPQEDDLRHGYVLTVHSSQGSEADTVYYIHNSSVERALLYTAITRAKGKVVIVSDDLKILYNDILTRPKKFIKTNIEHILDNLDNGGSESD